MTLEAASDHSAALTIADRVRVCLDSYHRVALT